MAHFQGSVTPWEQGSAISCALSPVSLVCSLDFGAVTVGFPGSWPMDFEDFFFEASASVGGGIVVEEASIFVWFESGRSASVRDHGSLQIWICSRGGITSRGCVLIVVFVVVRGCDSPVVVVECCMSWGAVAARPSSKIRPMRAMRSRI